MNETAKKLLDSPRAAHGVAGLALAIATLGAVAGRGEPPPDRPAEEMQVAPTDAAVRVTGKRLDIATDVELAAGASITAAGKVDIGARLVALDSCVGRYDEATRICVLSPGTWELHSGCFERSAVDAHTTCEVIVRNTGTLPLKFSGYVEVATPSVLTEEQSK
jgi:hypothetical protein